LESQADRLAADVESQATAWRRDLHEHPELSNREVRTAAVVADHLRKLGLEVRRWPIPVWSVFCVAAKQDLWSHCGPIWTPCR